MNVLIHEDKKLNYYQETPLEKLKKKYEEAALNYMHKVKECQNGSEKADEKLFVLDQKLSQAINGCSQEKDSK